MYRDGLGLAVLGGFEGHDGHDGVMLGPPGGPYHLELTRRQGHPAGPAPSAEHLLVFYEPEPTAWEAACARMLAAGFRLVPSENPYWDVRGRTFTDLEEYRVVWQRSAWPCSPASPAGQGATGGGDAHFPPQKHVGTAMTNPSASESLSGPENARATHDANAGAAVSLRTIG